MAAFLSKNSSPVLSGITSLAPRTQCQGAVRLQHTFNFPILIDVFPVLQHISTNLNLAAMARTVRTLQSRALMFDFATLHLLIQTELKNVVRIRCSDIVH